MKVDIVTPIYRSTQQNIPFYEGSLNHKSFDAGVNESRKMIIDNQQHSNKFPIIAKNILLLMRKLFAGSDSEVAPR